MVGKIFNRNNRRFGLLLGALTPLLGVVVYYYWKIYPNSWSTFMQYLGTEKRLLSSLTVVCLLFNVGIFTYYVNTQRDETGKGIFAATLVYAIASLLVKFWG